MNNQHDLKQAVCALLVPMRKQADTKPENAARSSKRLGAKQKIESADRARKTVGVFAGALISLLAFICIAN